MKTRARAGILVDTAVLASTFEYEEPALQTLLDAPTTELVKDFLASLTVKAQEFSNVKADKVRADVELENIVRSSEAKSKAVKASLTKSQKEVEELRKSVNSLENTRAELEANIDRIKSSSVDTSTEVDTFRARINNLEVSNRDTLALLESKSTAHDKLAEELSVQHQKIVKLRREVTLLEQKNQTLENASSAAKFKEQGLIQEVELLRKNVDWHEQELKTRGDEHVKFRKEKNARIAELQRINDESNVTVEAVQRTETILRQRVNELSQKTEESLEKIQKLEEAAVEADSTFKVELESSRRLADLQKQAADTVRARLQEVTESLEQVKDAASEEIGQLQAEVETERNDKEAVEARLGELESEVERLQSVRPQTPVPATPIRATNGLGIGHSPAMQSPMTGRSKGNLNFTQLYSENNDLKADLEAERRRTAALTAELEELIQDLESRGPEQQDLRKDKERMEGEIMEMSDMLDAALLVKTKSLAQVKSYEGQVDGLTKEGNVLRQQLRDLSAQIKILLVEMEAHGRGLDALDAEAQSQLQMLASGDMDYDNLAEQTSAGNLITQRLLLFKSVSELQEQNVQLLKLNRGLADRMEGDEARRKESEQANNLRQLEEAEGRLERSQDEIRVLTTQAQSITRERDMFRRMLSHRGPLPSNADAESIFGRSINGDGIPTTPRRGEDDRNGEAKRLADYAKLVKELQTHLDTLRQETSTNSSILRTQVDQLANEKSHLQTEVARTNGQITIAQERYEMLQGNYKMIREENVELQKRAQTLSDNYSRQDSRTQQVVEELVDAKSLAESMRTEAANLKGERDLWKKIETRMNEDNRMLTDERARLNKMLADVQNLQNEREQDEVQNKKRFQTRVDGLEADLTATRKKLELESEDSKKVSMRREYEQQQSQTRIDDLIKSLSNVREELVEAKTTRDQLQARVDELKIDLRNAEERMEALQPPRPATENDSMPAITSDNTLSHEQQLGLDVADLNRDLEHARSELESKNAQVEQYKSLSQATEEELSSLNDAADQYREDTDRRLAEKQGLIEQLEQRIEELNAELTTSNQELSELRTQHEHHGMELETQKTALESEVARLISECDRQREKAGLHQDDLRAQAEIAQQAQQSYEDELVKHAEAAKALQSVRNEYNNLRTEVAGIRAESEAAKTGLVQGQDTWDGLKSQYEKELSDLRTSREGLNTQNKLLHDQLESFSKQVAAIQQTRSNVIDEEAQSDQPVGTKLQEVITYLRREKEIVDVQYELASQESKRLKQQLDYTQTQLDDVRTSLSNERSERASHDTGAANQIKLLDTINELNLYRESSATLRQESRQAQTKLQEKITEIEGLTEQIRPLQVKVQEVENELEMKNGELKLLQEDRDRWRERTQNIISKYDRVDPEEIEGMKQRIGALETERNEFVAIKESLTLQIEAFPAQLQSQREEADKTWQESKAKLIEQAKNRSREQASKIRDLEKDIAAVREEKQTLTQQLTQLEENLVNVTTERDEAVNNQPLQPVTVADDQITSEQPADNHQEPQTVAIVDDQINATDELNLARETAESQKLRADNADEEVRLLQNQIQEQSIQVQVLENRVSDLLQQLENTPTQVHPIVDESVQDTDALVALQAELATTREELTNLRSQAEVLQVSQTNPNNEGVTPSEHVILQQVEAQVTLLKDELEAQHSARKKELEANFSERTNKMKQQLNQKLREGREKAAADVREELILEHSQALQTLRNQHEKEIHILKTDHQNIIEKIMKEGTEAVEAAKALAVTGSETSTGMTLDQFITAITDEQAKELVAKNEIVRSIVKRNITTKLEEQKQRIKEEHDKVVEEKVNEIKAEKDQAITKAVNMESMKQKVKLGMAEGQARNAKAKLEVVEIAANETPSRAVLEVWEIAKSAKAPPASAVVASTPTKTENPQLIAPVEIFQPVVDVKSEESNPDDQTKLLARQARFGSPSIVPTPVESAVNDEIINNEDAGVTAVNTQMGNNAAIRGLPRPTGSMLPRGGMAGRGNRGGTFISGLPRGGGIMGRGGRGGINRGGGGGVAPTGPSSPMNVGAKNFIPGQQGSKRPLEGGDQAQQGDGKRIRGGGGPGA